MSFDILFVTLRSCVMNFKQKIDFSVRAEQKLLPYPSRSKSEVVLTQISLSILTLLLCQISCFLHQRIRILHISAVLRVTFQIGQWERGCDWSGLPPPLPPHNYGTFCLCMHTPFACVINPCRHYGICYKNQGRIQKI